MLVSLYLQDELRLSPAAAGLVLLPFSVCAAAGSALAGRLPGSPRASIASGVGWWPPGRHSRPHTPRP